MNEQSFFMFQEVRGSAEVPESDIVQACREVSPLTHVVSTL